MKCSRNALDVTKIKGRMAEFGISGVKMASELNLSITGFYKKMNGKSMFKSSEVGEIAGILGTTPDYFYNQHSEESKKGLFIHAEKFLKFTRGFTHQQRGLLIYLIDAKFINTEKLDSRLLELKNMSENDVIDVFNKMVNEGLIYAEN